MVGKYEKLVELDGLYHYFYDREKVPAKLEPGNLNYDSPGARPASSTISTASAVAPATAPPSNAPSPTSRSTRPPSRAPPRLPPRPQRRPHRRPRHTSDARGPRAHDRLSSPPPAKPPQSSPASNAHGIGIRHGDFHSRRLVEHLGFADRGGVIGCRWLHYNTLEESRTAGAGVGRGAVRGRPLHMRLVLLDAAAPVHLDHRIPIANSEPRPLYLGATRSGEPGVHRVCRARWGVAKR